MASLPSAATPKRDSVSRLGRWNRPVEPRSVSRSRPVNSYHPGSSSRSPSRSRSFSRSPTRARTTNDWQPRANQGVPHNNARSYTTTVSSSRSYAPQSRDPTVPNLLPRNMKYDVVRPSASAIRSIISPEQVYKMMPSQITVKTIDEKTRDEKLVAVVPGLNYDTAKREYYVALYIKTDPVLNTSACVGKFSRFEPTQAPTFNTGWFSKPTQRVHIALNDIVGDVKVEIKCNVIEFIVQYTHPMTTSMGVRGMHTWRWDMTKIIARIAARDYPTPCDVFRNTEWSTTK